MKKMVATIGCLISLSAFAQFAPQVGVQGTTAIHKDSSVFVNWALQGTLQRGWQNCSDISLGYAQVGDSTYIPGKAGNGIVSLGDGGVATITFSKPIMNGDGYDFAVFENGFIDQTLKPGTAFLELAFVEVSSDGEHFYRFPSTSNTDTTAQTESFEGLDATKINNLAGKYLANYGTPFDLDELKGNDSLDVNKITHVRIIDVVGSLDNRYATYDNQGSKINDPWPTPFSSSGFDLDAVGVIHQNNSVGLTEVELTKSISVFPNPSLSNQSVTIVLNQPNITLTVLDATGKLQTAQTFSNYTTLSNLAPGFYVMYFTINNVKVAKKITVY